MRFIPLVPVLALVALTFSTVPAAGQSTETAGWSFSLGAFDVIDSDTTAEAGIEYRWKPFRFWFMDLNPTFGLSANADGAVWAYGGFRYDLPWRGERFVPTLGFAVSLYDEGDSKDLGGIVEFRSSLDLAWIVGDGQRVGVSFYHLSNARIYDLNPGEESLVFFWSLGR